MELDTKFLKDYINTPSPSGYELILGGQQKWIDQVTPFVTKVEVNEYGNAYAYYESACNKDKPNTKTVLFDAHADEIGFFVFDITPEGYIKVGRLGGSDVNITPSARVDIWVNKDTKIQGVFGHPAIHVQGKDGFKAEIHSIFIDIGVTSREDVEAKGIEIGTPITMSDGYLDLGDYYCGRSLDDKVGGFITSEVLRRLHEKKIELPFTLVVVNAVQEEVGLHGAKMAANDIKPDIAIAIDVTHDTTSPAYDKNKQGTLVAGNGIVLLNGPSIHKKVFTLLKDTAIDYGIDYQITASGSGSGTNADSYAYPHGIPTGLVKMAMKYMHTTVETVHKEDVASAIDLLYNFLRQKEILNSYKY